MSGLMGYGYISDSDESLKSKTGGKFGLNVGNCFLAKFAYSANVAKEGQEPREAIEVTVTIGDREYREWINPVTKVVDSNNVEITDKTSKEYVNGYNALMIQQNATVTHYLKSVGVTEDGLKAALAVPPTSFAEYATKLMSTLPIGFDKRPVDVFLEYQWNFGKKADGSFHTETYPTLPKNMKGGYFIVPAQPGIWKEARTEDGSLIYQNSNEVPHPIAKDANFMKSNKGTKQVAGQVAGVGAATAMTPGNGAAATTTWN